MGHNIQFLDFLMISNLQYLLHQLSFLVTDHGQSLKELQVFVLKHGELEDMVEAHLQIVLELLGEVEEEEELMVMNAST